MMRVVAVAGLLVVLCVSACSSKDKVTPQPARSTESNPVTSVGSAESAVACKTDLLTLQTAEEAYFALGTKYGTYDELVAGRFLADPGPDRLHTITVSSDGSSYTITGTGKNNCNSNYP
jgi:hypothetical protein